MAQEKRHMGRAGKLDFSIERVRAADGEWVPLRYTINKKSGGSHAVSTGVLTAGAAVLFWPAAPAFLLIRGKDVAVNKGAVFEAFTDRDHVMTSGQTAAAGMPAGTSTASLWSGGGKGVASLVVTSAVPGAEIELDGAFAGSTPTTLSVAAGGHQISVKSGAEIWQRTLQVNAGSSISVAAQLGASQSVVRRATR